MNLLNVWMLLAVNMDDLMKSLDIMWKGVVAIFVVIIAIIIVTNFVNKGCVKLEEKSKDKKDNE